MTAHHLGNTVRKGLRSLGRGIRQQRREVLFSDETDFIGEAGALEHRARQAMGSHRLSAFAGSSDAEEHKRKYLSTAISPGALATNQMIHHLSGGNGIKAMRTHVLN
jgi:hypothetical protein